MNDTKTIYLVIEGSYSNYGVRGVFDDKELAEEYAEQISGQVEEYKLNAADDMLERGYKHYVVDMSKSGDTRDIRKLSYKVQSCWRVSYNRSGEGYYTGDVSFYVCAKSEEGAIKVANERRAQLIALNRWRKEGEDVRNAGDSWIEE
jgi:hypothetical protein